MNAGVRIQLEPDYVQLDHQENLLMRGDRILVRPLNWDASAAIIAIRYGQPIRGEIVAAGPGAYEIAYNRDRSKSWETNTFVPMQLKIGDIVELGGLEIGGYSFRQILMNNEALILCTERDVCGVVDHGGT